jgi:hypothetical protein
VRDLLTGIAALLALALLALMVGPHFVDWDSQRGRVTQLIAERSGMPVAIAGPLSIRLLPTPFLEAEAVTVGPTDAPVATIRHIRLALSPMALLSGRLAFSEARLDEPVVMLPALQAVLARPEMAKAWDKVGFDRLDLDRVQVLAQPGGVPILPGGPYSVSVEAPNLGGPFRILAQDLRQTRDVKVQIGQLDGGRARMRATLEDRGFGGRLSLDGWFGVPGLTGRPIFDGAATFNGNPFISSPDMQVPFQGTARLIVQRNQAIADPVNLNFGGSETPMAWAGKAFLDLAGPRPQLRGRLDAKRLDATPFLVPGADGKVPQRPDLTRLAGDLGVDGEIELGLGALQLPGGLIQNLALRLDMTGEGAQIETASADLPGGTRLQFSRSAATPGVPLDGDLRVEAEDLKTLAAWLRGGDGVASLPQRASLAMRLRGDFAGIALDRIQIDSPAGQLNGAGRFSPASALTGALPRLALDLRAHRFDGRVLAALDPLRPVPGVDLSTRLAITSLVVDGRNMGGLDVDLERAQENGTLRHLRLTGLGGESIVLSGTTAGDSLTLTAKLDAARLGELSRIGAALLPGTVTEMILTRAAALEPALAVANIRLQRGSGQNQWDVAFDGKFGGTDVSGRSQSVQRGEQWQVSVNGRLANPDGARLAAQLSGASLPPSAEAGLVEIRASGNPRQLVSGQIEARLGASQLRFDGGLNPFRLSPVEGRLTIATDDAGRLGKAMIGAVPTLGDGMPARLAATIRASRETITLAGVEASLADLRVRGELGLDLTRGGQLAGQIRLGEISLEGLLAPALGRAWPDFRSGWPVTGFGPSVRPPLVGDLWIEAERLRLPDGTLLEAPQFVYRFGADMAGLEGFEARAGEARVAGGLTVMRKGEQVEAAGRLSLARWPLARPGGRLSGALPFAASGPHWQALVASLSGAGRVSIDDLVVSGMDPAGLPRVVATPIDAIDPVTELNVGALVERNLLTGDWRLPGKEHPAGLSQGQVRISLAPETVQAGTIPITITPTIQLDLLRREVEARFSLRQTNLPPAWRGATPEIGLSLSSRYDPRRGDMTPLQRRLDVASLLNGFLALAIQRDLEKAEAFEADLRERSAHLRRQRADQFQARRQREIQEVEAILEQDIRVIRGRAEAAAEFERQQLLRQEMARQAEEERRRREAEARQDQAAQPPPARGAPLNLAPPVVPPPPG